METPLVSVITIFRNAPLQFFEEAIGSVLRQTETRWELLLVDDGSTDTSADYARRVAAERPDRVRLLHHLGGENRGMSASRNLGIAAARGDLVAFLDADDLYLPEKLERQLDVFARHPEVALVYGPTLHWWSWTGDPADRARDHPRRLGASPGHVIRPPSLVHAFLEDRADTPATCAVLVRKAAIEAVGGFEPDFVDLFEDQAFFYKLLLAHSAYLEADAWDRYRRHPGAMCEVRIREGTHSDDTRPTAARGRFLAWLEGYLRSKDVTDRRLWRALRKQRWPYRHPSLHRAASYVESGLRPILPRGARRLGRRIIDALTQG